MPDAPFFPTSRWWWAAHPEGWGFASHMHVVHFNHMAAFAIEIRWNGVPVAAGPGTTAPAGVELRGQAPGLSVLEHKVLTPEDVLIALLDLAASAPGELAIEARSPLASSRAGEGFAGAGTFHAIPLRFAFASDQPPGPAGFRLLRRLRAGERLTARFALAAARDPVAASGAAARALAAPDPWDRARAEAEAWFAAGPQIDHPRAELVTVFLYRLAVARRALLDPRHGPIQHPAAAEGRWAARWYPNVITYGAGHQLAELRWFEDPAPAWGHLENFLAGQRRDGAFVGLRTDGASREYTDFIAWGALDLYLATGDRDRFARAAAGLARNADYVVSRDCDGDFLPEPRDHWETGMEWQPSSFAFSDYDTSKETTLERVDYASFLYANARAAARALELAGRAEEALRYHDIARRTALAVEGKMWEGAARFYFSLRAADDRMAPDREIVGFYPAAAGITAEERLGYLDAVHDPLRWATPFPLPSVERSSPAYAPARRWPLGPGGSASMWNGPVWPHAQSFVLRALGRAERAGRVAAGSTAALLDSYALAQLKGRGTRRDLHFPLVGELYDPDLAIWQTSERDYFHSTFVDPVVTLLAGIVPAEGDRLIVDPLLPRQGIDRFALVRLPYHGHQLALAWDAPDGVDAYRDGLEGLAVWIDGKLAATRPDLGRMELSLASTPR